MSFLDPQHNIKQFNLDKGMIVADLGSGSGFYAVEAARVVGNDGRVYAVDVQKDLLDRTKHSAELEGIYNIEVIWGDLDKIGGSKLSDMSVDAVIVSNILFQLEERDNFLSEIKRILRPNGRVLVVDWSDSFGGLGPAPETVFNEQQAEELFAKKGFKVDRKIDAGDNHYGIIFRQN